MATLGTTAVTLAQWAAHLAPDLKIAKVVEVLAKTNEMVSDIPWKAANQLTGNRTVRRLTLPTGTWRQLNKGVPGEIEITEPVTDTLGMLESYNDIDKKLYVLNGQSKAWRWQRDVAFIEGLTQTVATAFIYSDDVADPEKFKGLQLRYPTLATTNVIAAAAADAATNCSIYLCNWGETLYGIYPPGTNAGIQVEDLGQVTNVDAAGLKHEILRTHFQWDCGLVVEDPRSVVRICNIHLPDLLKTAATGADICDSMIQAIAKIPKAISGNKVFYMNSTIWAWLTRQMSTRSNLWWKPQDVGEPIMMFNNVPIHQCDALIETEAVVA